MHDFIERKLCPDIDALPAVEQWDTIKGKSMPCLWCGTDFPAMWCTACHHNGTRIVSCDICLPHGAIFDAGTPALVAPYTVFAKMSHTSQTAVQVDHATLYRSALNAKLKAAISCMLARIQCDKTASAPPPRTSAVTDVTMVEELQARNGQLAERLTRLEEDAAAAAAAVFNLEQRLRQEIHRNNMLARTSPNARLLHQNVYLGAMVTALRGTIASLQTQLAECHSVDQHMRHLDEQHATHMRQLSKAAREAAYADHQVCVVCQDAPRDVVLLPCAHFCVCCACSKKLQRVCPLCRQEVEQVSQSVWR